MNINNDHSSPNYWKTTTGKPLIIKPWAIVIHATAADTVESTLNWFKNPGSQASSQYVIDKDGEIYQLMPDNYAAWHAGKSSWKGTENMNLHSIGIELVNNGVTPYTSDQIDACIELVRHLMEAYDIKAEDVVGHKDISPGRKTDPYQQFPWSSFRKRIAALTDIEKVAYSEVVNTWKDGKEAVAAAVAKGAITDRVNLSVDKLWVLIVLYRLKLFKK